MERAIHRFTLQSLWSGLGIRTRILAGVAILMAIAISCITLILEQISHSQAQQRVERYELPSSVDRIANHQVEPWKLVWKGQAAVDFWRGHATQLQPGAPLAVVTQNMRVHTFGRMAEVTARVVLCALVQPKEKATTT